MQSFEAHVRCVRKTGTDSIKDAKGLNLATVSLLVDHDRWVDVGTELLPVANLIINVQVRGGGLTPLRLLEFSEAILHTFMSCIKVEVKMLMSTAGAILIDHRVARRVDLLDIAPPFE